MRMMNANACIGRKLVQYFIVDHGSCLVRNGVETADIFRQMRENTAHRKTERLLQEVAL